MGAVAINYFGKSQGESCYDPVFVLAAVMDWTGVATNMRGYIQLKNMDWHIVKSSATHRGKRLRMGNASLNICGA